MYKDADLFMVCVDTGRNQEHLKSIQKWKDELSVEAPGKAIVLIATNKDLCEANPNVAILSWSIQSSGQGVWTGRTVSHLIEGLGRLHFFIYSFAWADYNVDKTFTKAIKLALTAK